MPTRLSGVGQALPSASGKHVWTGPQRPASPGDPPPRFVCPPAPPPPADALLVTGEAAPPEPAEAVSIVTLDPQAAPTAPARLAPSEPAPVARKRRASSARRKVISCMGTGGPRAFARVKPLLHGERSSPAIRFLHGQAGGRPLPRHDLGNVEATPCF